MVYDTTDDDMMPSGQEKESGEGYFKIFSLEN